MYSGSVVCRFCDYGVIDTLPEARGCLTLATMAWSYGLAVTVRRGSPGRGKAGEGLCGNGRML